LPFNRCSSLEFKRDLEKDVVSETSGNFRRLLVSACTAGREQSTTVDGAKVAKDVAELFEVRYVKLLTAYVVICALPTTALPLV
jgi:hypothetical protein